MSPRDFVLWLKGFCEAAHHYNVTPAQWDILKDMLNKVVIIEKNE